MGMMARSGFLSMPERLTRKKPTANMFCTPSAWKIPHFFRVVKIPARVENFFPATKPLSKKEFQEVPHTLYSRGGIFSEVPFLSGEKFRRGTRARISTEQQANANMGTPIQRSFSGSLVQRVLFTESLGARR
jgi:hypothetical protein